MQAHARRSRESKIRVAKAQDEKVNLFWSLQFFYFHRENWTAEKN